jgi:extracellular elastinolytic metalloproteinase
VVAARTRDYPGHGRFARLPRREFPPLTLPAAPPRALLGALAAAASLLAPGAAHAAPERSDVARARAALQERLPDEALLRTDARTGTVRSLLPIEGALTAPSTRDAAAVVVDYVRANATALGLAPADVDSLRLTRRITAGEGLQYLVWSQVAGGIPASNATLRAVVDADGRLRALTGTLVPGLDATTAAPAVPAAEAYQRIRGGAPAVERRRGGARRSTEFRDGGSAELVIYRDTGSDRLAWRVLAPVDSRRFYDAIVDARTGAVERRFNRVRDARQIAYFKNRPGAPAGGVQETATIPDAWLPVSAGGTALKGPNAHAVLDLEDRISVTETEAPPFYELPDVSQADDVAADGAGDWDEPLLTFGSGSVTDGTWDDHTAGSWQQNAKQSATQLFWLVNRFHDHLASAPIGFDAQSGAFEGDDPIVAQALDGAQGSSGLPDSAHINNANMLTLPDGAPGFMQMYLFGSGLPEVDGANDASMVYHEYTHGLSGRLVTYSDGWDAMWAGTQGGQAGAIGEGTSDWYAMDFLVAEGLQPDGPAAGEVRLGEYIDGGTDAIRYEAVDCPVLSPCPGTATSGPGGFDLSDYGHVDDGLEVHSDGEIWAQTLWDVRSALVALHADGVVRARRYITGGLRIAPPEPSFLEMRDAIVQAAATSGGAGDVETLWNVFAGRGMGWTAATSSAEDVTPTARFDRPPDAETGGASSITQTSAQLSAVIAPNGTTTSYRFEFGEAPSLGTQTAVRDAGATGAVPVAETLAGLRPGTTYHYRVVALRGARQLAGAVRTFTTAPQPPQPPQPTPTPTPTPTPDPGPPVTATVFDGDRLSATRKGLFKVRLRFGSRAPAGTARITVLARRKRLARGTLAVRAGRTSTKTLTLNSTGRKTIKPGKSRKVTLELRLPDGKKVKKTVTLARRKR